ncbi:DUF6076 domain-containing protein [Lawsonibacter faecis]|uniref:Uncharacterized protein n=1 Tax=Lawsonibacter faecis TaxID=2763052 RepID=A0A8J6MC45_9FIRM|nr:DUF6076 domain-containing protein [Lawsonibacter faecis]MBC5736340.1 hypothetical protein [Lawsonibacter faecis]
MADHFDCFSVLFGRGELYIGGEPFPLGQCATDILNLDSAVLTELDRRVGGLIPAAKNLFGEKTDSAARSAQERLNAVWDLIFDLPVYRDLELDKWSAYNLFPLLLADQEKLAAALDEHSEAHQMFRRLMDGLEYFPESLRNFRGQVMGMLELYFDPIKRRGADAYAMAYAQYFSDMRAAGAILPDMNDFEQSFPVQVKFVPIMKHPAGSGKVILAEQAEFTYLSHFLYTDFYRGLTAGNAPRRCHNCGRYFLLTEGYNTCYCNNIAPGETERTCRKVGAHRKEAKERASATPAQKEYTKVYNRLKMRKQRGKISVDEWNEAVGKAQDLKEQSERGELSDEELRRQLEAL